MTAEALETKAKELLGDPLPVTRQPRKRTIKSFREGGIFFALKAVEYYDKAKQEYDPPVPKITFLVDGKYVRFPLDPKMIPRFAGFLAEIGELLKDVRIPEPKQMSDEERNALLRELGCGGVE